MKVLIVDDNQDIRELLRAYLPNSVENVFECTDGDVALETYVKHLPDWVLMDWEMPKTDGLTATRQIMNQFPKANICMVTAFDEEGLKTEALRAGATDFVSKDNLFELERILVNQH